MAKPKLYIDPLSQPCRACIIFARLHNLDVEEVLIRIDKGEIKSAKYLATNPFGRVPFLEDGEFKLSESAAILTYLAGRFATTDHWYPQQIQKRAAVDAVLHWYHGPLRAGASKLAVNRVIGKQMGWQTSERAAATAEQQLRVALREMNDVWLTGHNCLAGDDITIADLLCACEMEQLAVLPPDDGPTMAQLLEPHPRVVEWLKRVRSRCGTAYTDAHVFLHKLAQKTAHASARL